ncbi:MAG: hypothetical protein ACK4U0_04555 [Mesorhizobium sp.]
MLRYVTSLALTAFCLGSTAHAVDFKDKDSWCKRIASYDGAIGSTTALVHLTQENDDSQFRLRPIISEVPQGGTVAAILEAQRFLPDEMNLKLVQYINPQIADIAKVSPQEPVYLPSLERYDGQTWVAYQPRNPVDGFRVEQSSVPRLKKSIVSEAIEIKAELQDVVAENKLPSDVSEEFVSEYYKAFEYIAEPQWSSFSNSIDESDRYIVFAKQNNEIARSLIEAVQSPDAMSDSFISALGTLQLASYDRSSARGTVSVIVNTETTDGTKIDGLRIKYMSHGAKFLECDTKHGLEFATKSYDAKQVMGRSLWYFWAEDINNRQVTDAIEVDLTRISDNEYKKVIMVNN